MRRLLERLKDFILNLPDEPAHIGNRLDAYRADAYTDKPEGEAASTWRHESTEFETRFYWCDVFMGSISHEVPGDEWSAAVAHITSRVPDAWDRHAEETARRDRKR